MRLSRRQFLGSSVFIARSLEIPANAKTGIAIQVTKGLGCGCCTAWVEILRQDGFEFTEKAMHPADLVQLKMKMTVPQKLISCHTGQVPGYLIEGHVPPADIRRLLAEKPTALGLAVSGMPYGLHGMGPESEREAYDVILFKRDGSTSYKAAS